jgi:thiamine pyrophosphate-dependent acetolactate synthase large subunit-like protein
VINPPKCTEWLKELNVLEKNRDDEIIQQSEMTTDFVNPIKLCTTINNLLDDSSILIADGGDFVGTASYVVRPKGPLSWLDPGPFGTLGVGGGFALGSKSAYKDKEVWIIYGDGACAFSLAEFDTFVRHKLPVIAIVGNDASWQQIAREQVDMLGSPIGTNLANTAYHQVAIGYGGKGYAVEDPNELESVLLQAKEDARNGHPVLVNVRIGKTDFRKGSISV